MSINSEVKYLVWIDCEFTGPHITKDHILEIAILVTDLDLNIIDEKGFRGVVKLTEEEHTRLAPWVIENLGKNGLIDECLKSATEIREVERAAIHYLQKFIEPKSSPLCGNSIAYDRAFLEKDMLELSKFLHYRNIDVSTLKQLHNFWKKDQNNYVKTNSNHLAMNDIRESINELKFYKENFLDLD